MSSSKIKSRMFNQKPTKSSNSTKYNNSSNNGYQIENLNNQQTCLSMREKGTIEKLFATFGFIECKYRKMRLFFHFSEFKSPLDLLNIGDTVEFNESKDRKTGKPVAIAITKIFSVPIEIVSKKAVVGTVLVVAKSNKNTGSNGECPDLLDGMGRVSYEQEGETFFLPFALEDTNQLEQICVGDQIYFYISTDERNGNLRARKITKNKPKDNDNLGNISEVYNSHKNTSNHNSDISFNNLQNKTNLQSHIDNVQVFYNHNFQPIKNSENELDINVICTKDRTHWQNNQGKINGANMISNDSVINSGNHVNNLCNKNHVDLQQNNGGGDNNSDNIYKQNCSLKVFNSNQSVKLFNEYSQNQNTLDISNTICKNNDLPRNLSNQSLGKTSNHSSHSGETCINLEYNQCNGGGDSHQCRIFKSQQSNQGFNNEEHLNNLSKHEISAELYKPRSKNLYCNSDKVSNTDILHNSNLSTERNMINQSNETSRNAIVINCQGIVCSVKDKYGFIERGDVVREIFFHFSEIEGDEEIRLGDDVQFDVHIRNKKEVATNIRKLPEGTVIFEDVGREWKRGRILRTIRTSNGRRMSDALAGRIVYETLDGPIEIAFGEKDPVGDFTLNEGDIVKFNIATDRRDSIQHATNVKLLEDTFTVSKEKREKGFVTMLKEGFGFIRCVDREARMFFHFNEMLRADEDIRIQQEIEFTVAQDPTNANRLIATRIKILPAGTIEMPNNQYERLIGYVVKEALIDSVTNGSGDGNGFISYGFENLIAYSSSAVDGNLPKKDDKVEFYKTDNNLTNYVKVINYNTVVERGFIVTLKETFGFVETADHKDEIYFNFSNLQCNAIDLDLGDEVEFTIVWRGGKMSAENMKVLNGGSIAPEEIIGGVLEGRIIRQLHTYDCPEYYGLIQINGSEEADVIPFGISSLIDKTDLPLNRETVKFQCIRSTGFHKKWATNLAPLRKYCQAKIVKINQDIGILDGVNSEGENLTFNLSNVIEGPVSSKDDVEYVIKIYRGRTEACNVSKMSASQRSYERTRPERLISRLKSMNEDQKVIVIRAPKGPDDSAGFTLLRST